MDESNVSTSVVVVAAQADPVARAVLARWGALPAVGHTVDGDPMRSLGRGVVVLRRAGPHIHDEGVDGRLPADLLANRPTLVFPSVHRSEQNVACLAVHPLGNFGARAELGGTPHTLVPTDPPRMVAALRRMADGAKAFGWKATYEATHHGPRVSLPAFFVEIGFGDGAEPPARAVQLLADVLPELAEVDRMDRVAVGIGGGHYVPHFTDLALRRRWAFGHLVPRHALAALTRAAALAAFEQTPRAEGWVFSRAQDALHPAFAGLGRRLRDQDAPGRLDVEPREPTGDARSASGT